ncbi:MAG: hypothetical protein GY845_37345, partial [Planctomycetes bacterium]|nr:hypothetical protein [Planctomycetota bacterium]
HDWGPDTDVAATPADQPLSENRKTDQKPTVTPIEKSECSESCICVDKREGDRLGLNLCNGETTCETMASTDSPKYCYHKPQMEERSKCPDGCVCMIESEARLQGLAFCKGEKGKCGSDSSGSPLYCYQSANDLEKKSATDAKLRSVEVGE